MSSFTTKLAAIAAAFLLAGSSAQAVDSGDFALNSVVGFGGKEWYVIGNGTSGGVNQTDADTLRLLLKADDASAGYGTTKFRESGPYDAIYAGSTLQAKIQAIADSLGKESSVIKGNTSAGGDALWALSKDEWSGVTGAESYVSGKGAGEDSIFWLRTNEGTGNMYAGNAADGSNDTYNVGLDYGIRPAFDLDLSSVAFFGIDSTFTFFGEDYASNALVDGLNEDGTFSLGG